MYDDGLVITVTHDAMIRGEVAASMREDHHKQRASLRNETPTLKRRCQASRS
jgi:hypothetical protein